jgi:hypothetical protein
MLPDPGRITSILAMAWVNPFRAKSNCHHGLNPSAASEN